MDNTTTSKKIPTGATVAQETAGERPRRRIVRVVRRPRRSTWLYWVGAAATDLADTIDRTNDYLEQGRTAKAAEAFTDVFSLRRFAVLLPGGSKLRGATRPPQPVSTSASPVPPAQPAPGSPPVPASKSGK